jgi:predicted SprT family Zn-dependent metalloprotease
MNITTNATTTIEKLMAVKVANLLSSNKFPVDRISVEILFKDSMRLPSDSVLTIEDGIKPLHGSIRLLFNSLLISQDPAMFMIFVAPHEVAHVFNDLTAANNDEKFKKHGTEWQDWVFRLSDDPLVEPIIQSDLFDNRAAISRGGGCIAACSCDEPEYLAFGIRSEEYKQCSEGQLICYVCGANYKILPPGEVAGNLGDSIKYLHLISGFRSTKNIEDLMSPVKPY